MWGGHLESRLQSFGWEAKSEASIHMVWGRWKAAQESRRLGEVQSPGHFGGLAMGLQGREDSPPFSRVAGENTSEKISRIKGLREFLN